MKVIYLPSAKSDMRWFKKYYVSVFPEGKTKAEAQYLAVQAALKLNPRIGHPSQRHV
jgi:hypothetical protein